MKTVILGDIHNRWSEIEPIVEAEAPERIVFLGDYVNGPTTRKEEEHSLKSLAAFINEKRSQGVEIINLLGNHDMPYYLSWHDSWWYDAKNISGFRKTTYRSNHLVFNSMEDLKIVHKLVTTDGEDVILSHAGIALPWLQRALTVETIDDNVINDINNMLFDDVHELLVPGFRRGGWFITGSPIWCDAKELIEHCVPKTVQMVGHSAVEAITTVRSQDKTSNITFCDALSHAETITKDHIYITEKFL